MKWEQIPFGDIFELAPRELVSKNDLPVMSITMKDGLIDQSSKFKKRIASADISAYKVARYGQLVVGFPIDEGVIGFQCKYDAAAVSPAYDIWRLTGRYDVDTRFFERVLRSASARSVYSSKMRGTTNRRRSIPKDVFRTIGLPLPPLAEQKRIAAILDAADALRAKRRETLAELDRLLQSTFLDMFGDPVTNPKGWEVERLPRLVAPQKHSLKRGPFGGALKKDIFVQSGYKVYEQKHVIHEDFSIGEYFIDQRDFDRLSAFKVIAGDLLVSCSGTIGRITEVPAHATFGVMNQALLKLRLNDSMMLNSYFLFLWRSQPFERRVLGMTHGTGMKNMKSMQELKSIDFIKPPLTLQRHFAAIVESVEQQKARLRAHLAELDTLFASLQSRAFSGEL